MTDYRSLLEHDLRLAGPAGFSLHDLARRRNRKRRNQRLGTAALALILAAAAIGVLVRAFPLDRAPRPADLPTTPSAWSRYPLGPMGVEAITAGGPGLVTVGSDDRGAAVWTSSDGRTWTRVPGEELGPGTISDVTTGGPGLVAVGTNDNESARILGTQAEGPTHAVVWTSEDGRTWTRLPDDPVFRDALFANAVTAGGPGVVAVGAHNKAWFSSDGVTWDLAEVPPVPAGVYPGDDGRHPQIYLTDVAASGDRLVAAGWAMMNDNSEVPVIWTSVDGTSWANVPLDPGVFPPTSSVSLTAGSFTAGPGRFVAVGEEARGGGPPAMWVSPDGSRWRRVGTEGDPFASLQPDADAGSVHLSSVTAGSGGYVAVGQDGLEAAVWTSPDGESWARVPPGDVFRVVGAPPSGSQGSFADRVVAWGSRFVAEGEYDGGGAIWISHGGKGAG